MGVTAPYADDAADRIRFNSRHVITATAYPATGEPIPLDVEDADVQFDESWSPYVQASLTCMVPGDQETLDRLDSREKLRIKIHAGYVWDSVSEDVQMLADLYVTDREVKRPENRLLIRAASDEGLAQDFKRLSWEAQPPQSNLAAALQHHADRAVLPDPSPTIVSDFDASYGADAVAGVTQDPGQDSWSLIAESANRAGVKIFCDENRIWHIAGAPDINAEPSLILNTGGGGIIKDSTGIISRSEFQNTVTIKYSWRDSGGVDRVVYGNAYISSGPLSIYTIGRMGYYEEREIPATQAQADAAASKALRARCKRGRSYSMSAISAYWLRPRNVVTVSLPDAEQERLLVSSVQFTYPAGSMNLRLRRPEDVTISNS
jgi:hypothetical protein